MADNSTSAFYEIWFEHGVFITPGPRFARLDEAVEHARLMVQTQPQTSVSIRFPNTPVDTFVRTKTPPLSHENADALFTVESYSAHMEHDLYGMEDEDTSVDELNFPDGHTSPYGDEAKKTTIHRRSGFQKRTTVMNSNQIKKGLKKLG